MLRTWSVDSLGAELGALEESLERARGALACPYSCADEFEAAVIRAQRARGAFKPRRTARLRLALTCAATSMAVLLVVLLLFRFL
ncbi:MAG TPA: hypothetical protein VHA77_15970 [Xanthobacteraceae bacterium]|jgi:hypothetical protein|nr:hypothetical protein [Xanthobacteraceae bacterium]